MWIFYQLIGGVAANIAGILLIREAFDMKNFRGNHRPRNFVVMGPKIIGYVLGIGVMFYTICILAMTLTNFEPLAAWVFSVLMIGHLVIIYCYSKWKIIFQEDEITIQRPFRTVYKINVTEVTLIKQQEGYTTIFKGDKKLFSIGDFLRNFMYVSQYFLFSGIVLERKNGQRIQRVLINDKYRIITLSQAKSFNQRNQSNKIDE